MPFHTSISQSNKYHSTTKGTGNLTGLKENDVVFSGGNATNTDGYSIRMKQKEDYREVENLVWKSFWNVYRPGCSEHYVIHTFRDNPTFEKAWLSLWNRAAG